MTLYELNLRHLRAALAIADTGTLSGAARAANISQPAISQSLAGLEKQLGEPLFVRNSAGATMTEAGGVFVGSLRPAFAYLKAGFRHIRRNHAPDGFTRADRMVTMPQIRALIALADHGSYSGASAMTGLANPSLHRAVRELETITSVKLVERRGRGIAITPAGRRLVRSFRLARTAIDNGIAELVSLAGQQVGRIAVGAMPLSRARVIPKAFAAIHRRHPALALTIVEGPYAELLEKLRDGDLDFLIGARRSLGPGADIEQRALFYDSVAVIGACDHPLAERHADRPAPADILARYPWVVPPKGAPLRRVWQRFLGAEIANLPFAPITCSSTMATRALLREGPYLTLLSRDQVRMELEEGMLAAIGGDIHRGARSIVLTQRSDWRRRPVHDELIAEIERAAQ